MPQLIFSNNFRNIMKNPKWTYRELILALETYIYSRPKPPGKNSIIVKNLSLLLKLNSFLKKQKINKTFRNNNGVAMKLQNFRSLDDQFKGKGLRRGGGLELELWNKFNSLNKISKEADKVRKEIENELIG